MPLDVQQAIDASEQATLRALTVMNSRPPVDPGRNMPPVKGGANVTVWSLVGGIFSLLWWLIKLVFFNPVTGWMTCIMLSLYVYRALDFLCGMDVQGACRLKGLMDGAMGLFIADQLMKAGGQSSGNTKQESKTQDKTKQESKKTQAKTGAEEDPQAVKACCDDVLRKATAGLSEAQQEQVERITKSATAGLSEAQQEQVERITKSVIETTVTKRMNAIDGVYTTWLSLLSGVAMIVFGSLGALWACVCRLEPRITMHDASFANQAAEVRGINTRLQKHDEDILGLNKRVQAFEKELANVTNGLSQLSMDMQPMGPGASSGRARGGSA